MRKQIVMILFVLFAMASFTLVEYQPPVQPEQSETVVDNLVDVNFTAFDCQPEMVQINFEGVAISTGGTQSLDYKEAKGLNIKYKEMQIAKLDIYDTYDVQAIQSTKVKRFKLKKGREVDFDTYMSYNLKS